MKAHIKFRSMDIDVDGTSREIAALIKDLHESPHLVGENAKASVRVTKTLREPSDTPEVEEVAQAIRTRAACEHTAKSLMVQFFGKALPARKEGASNPDYLRFLHRVKTARQLIEQGDGVKFVEASGVGREKVYKTKT